MRKFAFGISNNLVLKYKGAMLNKDMNIFRLVVYTQRVEEEEKMQSKVEERQVKRVKYTDHDTSQQQGGK